LQRVWSPFSPGIRSGLKISCLLDQLRVGYNLVVILLVRVQ
jgi:hypothetical protein